MFEEFESRRSFLGKLAVILGSPALVAAAGAFNAGDAADDRGRAAGKATGGKTRYRISEWTGDDFTRGHRFRAGDLPEFPPDEQSHADVVIIGGGIAGLSAAYKLKDHDFLLLEQYDQTGGHARGGSHRGIDYSWGAAYAGTLEGIYGDLYADLGIEPVKFGPERNAWLWRGNWQQGVAKSGDKGIYSKFKQLMQEQGPLWKVLPEDLDPQKMIATPELARLDKTPFNTLLNGYGEDFVSLVDSFCRSSFCGGADQISALAGVSLCADLVADVHVFKGGNQAISKGLHKKIESAGAGRIKTGAFVWKVEVKNDRCLIRYTLADGSAHTTSCRFAIVATPPLVAARQLAGVDNKTKALLLGFKFGSYLVANLLLRQRLFGPAYDSFVAKPYSFSDIIAAEAPYVQSKAYQADMGSVLTVYQPYPAGSPGRTLLLLGNKEEFAASLFEQMKGLVKGFGSSLEEIVLTRWGHALAIVGSGYYTRLSSLQTRAGSPFCLAHSSLAGGPSVEAAIRAGFDAAARALQT